MDARILEQKILSDPENIVTILEKLGHTDVKDRGKYLQLSNLDGDNSSAISILKENLLYKNYTRGESGNLFTLIMYDKKITFPDALKFAAKCIGYKDDGIKIRKPFGGFYTHVEKDCNNFEIRLPVYEETKLPNSNNLSKLWYEDGVDIDIQIEYGIRYDLESDSIIIPVRDYYGNLVGAKKRINKRMCDMGERWGMYIPYAKSLLCYGWTHNYQSIKQQKKVIILEAEKSVAQLSSIGYDIGLAIGGHNISPTQAHWINTLQADKIVVAFDEGLSEEEVRYETKKLMPLNGIYRTKVGYIYDGCGEVLACGSKDSPTDHGKEVFQKLCKNNITWLEG